MEQVIDLFGINYVLGDVDIVSIDQQARIDKRIWLKKDDSRIKVSDMSTSHVQNTIKMLKRGDWHLASIWIEIFETELNNRIKGDGK